jgi:hypothetical protein
VGDRRHFSGFFRGGKPGARSQRYRAGHSDRFYPCGLAGDDPGGGVLYPAFDVDRLVFAWAYVQFGALPQLEGMLYGIKPVVVAIIISAMWGMLKPRLKDYPGLGVVLVVFVAYLLGVNPILLLLGGGVVMGLIKHVQRPGKVLPLP